jgi:hypothetical protein
VQLGGLEPDPPERDVDTGRVAIALGGLAQRGYGTIGHAGA